MAAADPFEAALAEIEGGGTDPFEAALAEIEGAPSQAESAYRGAVQGASLSFGDEVAAGFGAGAYGVAKGVRSLLPGGVPEDALPVGEVYDQLRDQFRAENAAAQAANPGTYATGEIGGVLATSGVNPVSALRAGGRSLLALGTREAYTAAAGRALLTQGAKGAAVGGGLGAVNAAGASEADVGTEQFFTDVLEGAEKGAEFGAGAGALLGVGSRASAARAQRAAGEAATAEKVVAFDEAAAMLPAQQAAVKAGNAEVVAAAKAESKAATKAKQAAAQQATREQTLANPLVRTGLEGKQSTLRGPKRARARAQALVDEPLPGDPSKKLVDEAEKLGPAERLELATGLRRSQGAELGKIRDELAKTEIPTSVEAVRAEMRGAFGELPSEVQGRALEQVDALIAKVAKDGALTPDALRKLITDAESLSKFSTPSLEAALGNARGRVFQTARQVLVNYEQAALAKARPDLVPEYVEGLRKYGVYSDFELGSDVMFRKANRGKPTVTIPKAGKVEPEVVQPVLLPEPQAPQFPGGEEALAKGRALLQPSRLGQLATRAIAGEAGARAGALLPVPGAALAGARIGDAAAGLWTRVMTPSAASLSAKAQKLERLRPLMEEAVLKGPAEVARIHALFMQRSPDYRKAVESGE